MPITRDAISSLPRQVTTCHLAASGGGGRAATPGMPPTTSARTTSSSRPTGTPISARCADSAPIAPTPSDVAEPEACRELVPRARDAQQRQQRDADDEVETFATSRPASEPVNAAPAREVVAAGELLDAARAATPSECGSTPTVEHDVGLLGRVDLDRRQQVETAEDAPCGRAVDAGREAASRHREVVAVAVADTASGRSRTRRRAGTARSRAPARAPARRNARTAFAGPKASPTSPEGH